MRIGIIDADLIGRDKHRFPNLVCEKISGYYKDLGDTVELLLDYSHFEEYDHIYISKVFTDTWVPEWIQNAVNMDTLEVNLPDNIHVGGTGFFFAQAPNLVDEIEHHMPDYHLYDDWIEGEVRKAERLNKNFNRSRFMQQFKEYTDYSIGFITRGCFRRCPFCVNQRFDHVFVHSPLEEFYDVSRKKLCFLDDNFLGCPNWRELLEMIIATGKPFKFKQGLDERILTNEKCDLLFNAKYDGDYTFAFDNIADYDLIHQKLEMIKQYNVRNRSVKFYVLVGFESTDEQDIENAFKRIALLMKYKCLPYVMRYMNRNETPWKSSPYRHMYVALARWCNQPSIFKKMSFRQFCEANQALHKNANTLCSSMRALVDFEQNFPGIAREYFDLRFENV